MPPGQVRTEKARLRRNAAARARRASETPSQSSRRRASEARRQKERRQTENCAKNLKRLTDAALQARVRRESATSATFELQLLRNATEERQKHVHEGSPENHVRLNAQVTRDSARLLSQDASQASQRRRSNAESHRNRYADTRLKAGIVKFRAEMSKMKHRACDVCQESFPDIKLRASTSVCYRCATDTNPVAKLYSKQNNMDPGEVPAELQGLTQIEQMLIAQIAVIMKVHPLHGGQLSYGSNVINFPQDVADFVTDLPPAVHTLPIITVRRSGADPSSFRDFRVRRMKILTALVWLKSHHKFYRDITINRDNLAALPEDDFVDNQLRTVVSDSFFGSGCNSRNGSGAHRRNSPQQANIQTGIMDHEPYADGESEIRDIDTFFLLADMFPLQRDLGTFLLINNLKMVPVDGDGNCFFRAYCVSRYGADDGKKHKKVRKNAHRFMIQHRTEYVDMFANNMPADCLDANEPRNIDEALHRLGTSCQYASQFDITAVCRAERVNLYVFRPAFLLNKVFNPLSMQPAGPIVAGQPRLVVIYNGLNHYTGTVSIVTVDSTSVPMVINKRVVLDQALLEPQGGQPDDSMTGYNGGATLDTSAADPVRVEESVVLEPVSRPARGEPCNDSMGGHNEDISALPPVAVDCSDEDIVADGETFAFPEIPRRSDQEAINDIVGDLVSNGRTDRVMWPRLGTSPINEFEKDSGYIVRAFPSLFPTGACDLRDVRPREVKPMDYFRHLLKYRDGRFARDPRFPFFAFNSSQRWTALTQGQVFLKHLNPTDRDMPASDFRQKYAADPKGLSSRIMHFAVSLRGTRQFWYKIRQELMALINQEGPPAIFFTFSFADMHCWELHRLMPNGLPAEGLTNAQKARHRHKNVCENPLLSAWFLEERFKSFMKNVIEKLFVVRIRWHRNEWQHRGTGHYHGFLWLKDQPDITNMDSKSEEERELIIAYFDKIVTTWNTAKDVLSPDLHPSQLPPDQLDDSLKDFGDCQNMLERHTRCMPKRCLVVDRKTKKQVCRFHFPKELQNQTILKKDEKMKWQLLTRRNDVLLTPHNPILLQTWRANCDFSPIVDLDQLVRYASKYASKNEVSSKSFAEIFAMILLDAKENDSIELTIQKLILKSVCERDYSAQEVCHMMYSLPIQYCSKKFVYIHLYENSDLRRMRRGNTADREQDSATEDNFIRKYMNRQETEEVEDLSLRLMARQFKSNQKGVWQALNSTSWNILCILPVVAVDNVSEAYCRQRMILDVPFRHLSDLRGNYSSWQAAFAAAFSENNAPRNFFDSNVGLLDDEYEDIPEGAPGTNQALWQQLAAMNPHYVDEGNGGVELGLRPMDMDHDWEYYATTLYADMDYSSFLVRTHAETGDRPGDVPFVNPDTLNPEQRRVFNAVTSHHRRCVEDKSTTPLLMIVQGAAGTGKSHLIRAIQQHLNAADELTDDFSTRILLAPTGVAAANIGGATIHSRLRLPLDLGKLKDLTGEGAKTFQQRWQRVYCAIVDEWSMISPRLLAAVSKRMGEARPRKNDVPFGGMTVILFGDLYQLPPVADRCLFVPPGPRASSATSARAIATKEGQLLYRQFAHAAVLTIQQQQTGEDQEAVIFRGILDRLKIGRTTHEDWLRLMTRVRGAIPPVDREQFGTCLHIFTSNSLVDAFNYAHLTQMNVSIARIEAVHNIPAAKNATYDVAGGLDRIVYVAVGCRVMLNANLWTTARLVNGAVGTVVGVVYEQNERPPALPTAVIVQFDDYTGPSCFPDTERCVPIVPLGRNWQNEDGLSCSRTQIPLSVAHAVTVHKAQGTTLPRAAIDIGKREFVAGLASVALSRVKRFRNFVLTEGFPLKRLENLWKRPGMAHNVAEEERLKTLGLPDFS